VKVSINDLRENPDNPRSISGDKFEKLVNSIRQFPEMMEARPIVVDQNNVILGGNMRFKAAKEAGLQEVDVYVASWDEAKNPEFIIKDNVGFGEWDWDMLANEWDAVLLDDWGLDVWQEEEEKEGLTDPDEVPEVPADPVIQLGDLWILGEHRLLCGDSTKAEDVERLMDGATADALVTDPPYGINANKQTLGKGKKEFERGGDWDAQKPDILPLLTYCKTQIVWGGNYFADVLPPSNDWLCWHKKNDGRSYSEFELAWSNLGKNCRLLSHHWGGENKLHPTMKPVAVMEWCMNMTEGTIFDPFLGSGSTLIAAEKTGRKCYGMELDPKYCDVIVKRWEDFTGQKASKANA
jgi:hypothetical protein